ncbi:phage holin family protein [Roseateles sp. BYS180W]|uniref:Phage holin family protein n=1 Tax=Roseateles rivi TaxID=3299028 RepID=A0ABW7FR85_9BURK
MSEVLRRRLLLVLAALSTRLALLGTDLEQEKLRLMAALSGLLTAWLLGATALLMAVLALLLLCPEPWRWALASGLALALGLAAWRCLVHVQAVLSSGQPFAATLAELQRDRDALGGGPSAAAQGD